MGNTLLKLFLFYLSVFTFHNLSGQELQTFYDSTKINKLIDNIKNSPNDTTQLNLLIELTEAIQVTKLSEAEKYGTMAVKLAKELNQRQGIAKCCYRLGSIKADMGKFTESDTLLNEALNYFKKIKNKRGLSITYRTLGNLRRELGYNDQAEDFYKKSISQSILLKDEIMVWETNLSLGTLYMDNLNDSMVDYHNEDIDKTYDLFSELIRNFSHKVQRSNVQSNDSLMKELWDDLTVSNVNMGELWEMKEKNDSAEHYYLASLKYASLSGMSKDLMIAYQYYGKICLKLNRVDQSIDYLLKALAYAIKLESKQNIASISKCLSEDYALKENFKLAYFYLNETGKIEKEIKLQEATKNIARKEWEKQKQISENRTILLYSSLICLLISILLVLTLFFNYRIKKKANKLLVEMDELKSRLFSNITHEFRTPLTLILGPLEELLSEGEKRNLTQHEIKIMRKNANRLLNLVNQMLDLAKLDAKSLKIELAEGDFVQFFKVNVMVFASLAEQKKLLFHWSVPAQPMMTYFDADKLEKIINNLISNAIKYTEKGGEVNCTLEILPNSPNVVKFRVSDTGKGISGDHLPRIFDRFYQAEGTSGPDSYGTGIGLSLTKELITLLHGEITAESEWGKGSRFTVTLPLGYKHLKSEEYIISESGRDDKLKSREVEALQDAEYPGMTDREMNADKELPLVLVVEDQSDLRNYLTGHLKDSFRLIESENGRQGFDQAVQNLPDLVITDLVMPEMDGLELCGKLKTDERTGHIPVIMLTARTGLDEKMAGLETGADQYLTKPFHMKELRLIIRKLIEQRLLLRKRFSRDLKLEPKDIAITSADEKFLNRALAVIDKHMGDFDFDVNTLQEEMAMSRMQLFRKIKALTDQTPGDFIRTIRLKRAERLIAQGFGNMAQVTFEVGFNNPSYFAKCFREMYGVLPSEYAKRNKPDNKA